MTALCPCGALFQQPSAKKDQRRTCGCETRAVKPQPQKVEPIRVPERLRRELWEHWQHETPRRGAGG